MSRAMPAGRAGRCRRLWRCWGTQGQEVALGCEHRAAGERPPRGEQEVQVPVIQQKVSIQYCIEQCYH